MQLLQELLINLQNLLNDQSETDLATANFLSMQTDESNEMLSQFSIDVETIKERTSNLIANFEHLNSTQDIIDTFDDVEFFNYFSEEIQNIFNLILDQCVQLKNEQTTSSLAQSKSNAIADMLVDLTKFTRTTIKNSDEENSSLIEFYDTLSGISLRTSNSSTLSPQDLRTLEELEKNMPVQTNLLADIIKLAKNPTAKNSDNQHTAHHSFAKTIQSLQGKRKSEGEEVEKPKRVRGPLTGYSSSGTTQKIQDEEDIELQQAILLSKISAIPEQNIDLTSLASFGFVEECVAIGECVLVGEYVEEENANSSFGQSFMSHRPG